MPTNHVRRLVRAAGAVRNALTQRTSEELGVAPPARSIDQCQRLAALYELTTSRRWGAAARQCDRQLRLALEDLNREVWAVINQLDRPRRTHLPSLRELYDDLAGLEREFENMRIDLKAHIIAVTTEPIELEGVYLGRFEIVFDWRAFSRRSHCYEVVALDAHAASADGAVTHPHVRDNDLCEGDASSGLRAALDAGRLFDFFVIVAQTLATYNASSAFVSLDRWHGSSCSDCGATTCDDDSTSCERCECELCDDCGSGCTLCGRTVCSDCGAACAACRESLCAGCLTACSSCANYHCERCISDDQCQRCREAAEEAAGQTQAHPAPAPPLDAANLPLRVGEAAVPA